jgi:CTP:molybdopterin cytidylyltransferase MocA
VLSLSLRPQIDALEGDSGAGPLLRTIAGIVEWPVEDASVLQDIDTVAALAGLSRPPR